jgi:choline dehydrogenase-like flavoprotein
MRWDYYVSHYDDPAQAARDDTLVVGDHGQPRGVWYPRGSGVGGSTAMNAMIAVYPHASDGARTVAEKKHFTWVVLKAHTQNAAGQVSLRSSDPRERVEVSFRYFDASGDPDGDLAALVGASSSRAAS